MEKERILFTNNLIEEKIINSDFDYFVDNYNIHENLCYKDIKENYQDEIYNYIETYKENCFKEGLMFLKELKKLLVTSVIEISDMNLKKINIEDILFYKDYFFTLYIDKDLKLKNNNFNETIYFTYRVFKKNITEEQIENFIIKYKEGKLNNSIINNYTESLVKYVNKLFNL